MQLIKGMEILVFLLVFVMYLHEIFSKPLKDIQFIVEAGGVHFEVSCDFFEENELKISQ